MNTQLGPVDVDAVLAATRLGQPHADFVDDVRDGVVVRCSDCDGRCYALKAINTAAPKRDDHLIVDRAATARHEATILRRNAELTDRLYVASGQLSSIVWLLTRWIDGQPSDVRAETLRARRSPDALCQLAHAIIDRVAELHATGYVHGDLQPAHVIVQPDSTVALIDFEFAHRPGDSRIAYRGGLVHYTAPEIAQALLDRQRPVPYDHAAEIYSLGAVLYHLTTGRMPIDYGTTEPDALPYETKLAKIAHGYRRNHGDLPMVSAELRDFTLACLNHHPHHRPDVSKEKAPDRYGRAATVTPALGSRISR